MAIETLYETEDYRYDYDSLYGTGWFVRKSDDAVSLMETGSEAEESKVAFDKIIEVMTADNAKRLDAIFNSVAIGCSYSPRWSDEEKADMRHRSRMDE